jgi:pilus assembly protein CpaB
MAIDVDKKRRILLAGVMGLAAVLFLFFYIKGKEKEIFGGSYAEVFVASRDIARETIITEECLLVKKFPIAFVHPNAIFSQNKDIILGQPARYNFKKGQPLLWSDIGKGEGGLSSMLNSGERALTLSVDEISGIAGALKPNDRVDILGIFEIGGKSITKILMQNVTILMVGSNLSRGENKEDAETNLAKSLFQGPYSSITVAVMPEEAEILAFAQDKGKLVLTLRGQTDLSVNEDFPSISMDSILKIEGQLTARRKERQGDKTEIIKGGVVEEKREEE